MIERIPPKGATDEQLALVRERLSQLFPVAEGERIEPPAPVVLPHGRRRRAARAGNAPAPASNDPTMQDLDGGQERASDAPPASPPPVRLIPERVMHENAEIVHSPRFDDARFLARLGALAEPVWYWDGAGARAAIVTFVHLDGRLDLAVFAPTGISFLQTVRRRPNDRGIGWTPKGCLT